LSQNYAGRTNLYTWLLAREEESEFLQTVFYSNSNFHFTHDDSFKHEDP